MKYLFTGLLCCAGCLLLIPQLGGCGSGVELESHKIDRPIVIDGKDDDWQGVPVFLEKQKISLGCYHDGTSLSIVLTTTDHQTQMAILGPGLNIWFDSTGSDEKVNGVHFPVRTMDQEPPSRGKDEGQDFGRGGMMEQANAQLAILGHDNEQKRVLLLPNSEGYGARIGMENGKLVYELQVPMIHTAEKGTFSIGFEIPSMTGGEGGMPPGGGPPDDGPPGGSPPGGGSPGGGPPGGGPPGGGGMGAPPGGGAGEISLSASSLNFWVKVHTAAPANFSEPGTDGR